MGCNAAMTWMVVNLTLSACRPVHELRGKHGSLSSPSRKLSPFSTRQASPLEHDFSSLQGPADRLLLAAALSVVAAHCSRKLCRNPGPQNPELRTSTPSPGPQARQQPQPMRAARTCDPPECSAGEVTALPVSAALLLQLWAPLLHTPGGLVCRAGGLLTRLAGPPTPVAWGWRLVFC